MKIVHNNVSANRDAWLEIEGCFIDVMLLIAAREVLFSLDARRASAGAKPEIESLAKLLPKEA